MNIIEVNARLDKLAEEQKGSFNLEENKLRTIEGISGIIHGISRNNRLEMFQNIGLTYTSLYFGKDTVEELDLNKLFSGVFKEGLEHNQDVAFREGLEINFSNTSFAICSLESLMKLFMQDGYDFHFCFGVISSMLSVSTLFNIDFVEAIKSCIEWSELIPVKHQDGRYGVYNLNDEVPDGEIISIIFDDKCIKEFIIGEYDDYEPLTFGDVLKRAKQGGYKEDVITVLVENYRNGYVFKFGNYDTEKFYQVGTTQGFV